MKLTTIISEAWRNLVTGTTRAAVFAISLALIVGTLCVTDARAVVSLLSAARTFQTSGASTIVLTAPHAVSGTRCEQLTHLAGVQAAGAIRQTTDLTTKALPDAPLPQWQATPGFTHVISAATTGQSGILASQQVADQLSLNPGDSLATDHGTTRVAGTYPYPDDGRLQTLTYAVIAPVPATGTFDACPRGSCRTPPAAPAVCGPVDVARRSNCAGSSPSRSSPWPSPLGSIFVDHQDAPVDRRRRTKLVSTQLLGVENPGSTRQP